VSTKLDSTSLIVIINQVASISTLNSPESTTKDSYYFLYINFLVMSIHSKLAVTHIKAIQEKEKLANLSKSKLDSTNSLSQIKCRKIYKNKNKKVDKDSKSLRAPI
jgi:hypothetical protein